MDNQFQPPLAQANYPNQGSGKSKKFLFIVIFLLLLLGVGYLVVQYFLPSKNETKSLTITPTPTEYQFPTDTPTPQATPTASLKPTTGPTTKPTTNPVDQASGLDRSTLSVEVQNGSGEAGVAAKASDILKGFGYKVASTGNADNYDYQDVTIQVKSTKSKYLTLLKKDLGFSYTVGTTSADLSSESTADALIIIGK
ncbi:MAG: LytR C-terminal domain-containing protein [Candidatus Levybacteria bacterium]|nr:LytR C-terminal domain-containing protein [Candidatus Levybacteria bacterium]